MRLYNTLKPELIKINCTADTTESLLKEMLHHLKTQDKISNEATILKKLMEDGKIIRSPSAIRVKRKRVFNRYAKKWLYGMKGKRPGQMIQIDHMTVSKNGITVKHFQAWDPKTKTIIAEVYSNATSRTAKRFLKKLSLELPFPILSIQVDGGSEFMKHFEEFCEELKVPLYVLPPKRPQYNGGVERGNRIFREEFYQKPNFMADSVGAIRFELNKAVDKYNTYRPHNSLNGLTPYEYTQNILEENSVSV